MIQDWLIKQAIAVLIPVMAGWLNPYLTVEAKRAVVAWAKSKVGLTDTPFDDAAVAALAAAWSV